MGTGMAETSKGNLKQLLMSPYVCEEQEHYHVVFVVPERGFGPAEEY